MIVVGFVSNMIAVSFVFLPRFEVPSILAKLAISCESQQLTSTYADAKLTTLIESIGTLINSLYLLKLFLVGRELK